MTDVLRRRGMVAIFTVRILPFAPFAVESMVAGATRIGVAPYLAGTLLGMLPGTLTTAVFGAQIRAALADPAHIDYLLPTLAVLAFLMVTFAVRRWLLVHKANGAMAYAVSSDADWRTRDARLMRTPGA